MNHFLMKATSTLRRALFGPRPVDDPSHGPSEELQSAAKDLRQALEKYKGEPDPLVALMTDIFNKREMRKNNGNPYI